MPGRPVLGAMRGPCFVLRPTGCTGVGQPGRLATHAVFAALSDSGWVRAEASPSPLE